MAVGKTGSLKKNLDLSECFKDDGTTNEVYMETIPDDAEFSVRKANDTLNTMTSSLAPAV